VGALIRLHLVQSKSICDRVATHITGFAKVGGRRHEATMAKSQVPDHATKRLIL